MMTKLVKLARTFFLSVSESLMLFPYLEYHNMGLFYIYLHKVEFFFFIQAYLFDISKEKHMLVHINRFSYFFEENVSAEGLARSLTVQALVPFFCISFHVY